MLNNGPYPFKLRQRILSDKGHLSNYDSAKYLSTFVGNNTKYILLAHLSEENNTKDGYEGLHKKTRTAKITKQEWAIYYKIIGDEQHGDFIYRTKFGQRAVRVETDNSYKIFIDNGEYDNARVLAVYSFASSDDVSDTIDYMRTIGVIL